MSRFPNNALAPTMSTPLGSSSGSSKSKSKNKNKRPISDRAGKPAKRHRTMVVHPEEREEEDVDKKKKHAAIDNKKHTSDTWQELISALARFLPFRSPSDIQPSASTSSSSSSASAVTPGGRSRAQRAVNHTRNTQNADHTLEDFTHEPEDDSMFLSVLQQPPALMSNVTSSSSSSTVMTPEGSRRRREPMFNGETKERQKVRRDKALQAIAEVQAHTDSRLRATMASSGTQSSSRSMDGSSYGLLSPAYESSNTTISSQTTTGRAVQAPISSAHFNRNNVGIGKTNSEFFDDYARLVKQNQFGAKDRIIEINRRSAYRSPANDQDVLAHRKQPPAQTSDVLDRTLINARQALESPKPKTPRLAVYSKSKLKDKEVSEHIDDIQRRRRIWPDRMPDEHLKIVEAVLRTPGMIASLPAAEVAGKDIVKLSPAQWLNDEIINFYGVMVNLRSAAAKTRRDKGFAEPGDENLLDVHVFNSFFFSKFSEGGYNSVRRWTKKFDVFKKDIIIMPVNLGNAHWVCAAINVEKQRFEYYDSMGQMNYNVTDKLRDYVEAEHLDKKRQPIDLNGWEDYHNPRTPQQANHYDCGVFTSQFIECLSRRDGHFDFDQTNMPYLRQKMIHEIKMMQLTPEKWFDPNE